VLKVEQFVLPTFDMPVNVRVLPTITVQILAEDVAVLPLNLTSWFGMTIAPCVIMLDPPVNFAQLPPLQVAVE
jgi:hypothetical protein